MGQIPDTYYRYSPFLPINQPITADCVTLGQIFGILFAMDKKEIIQNLMKNIWPHVENHGWSWSAFDAFCQNEKKDLGQIKLAFPGGLDELLIALNAALDAEIVNKVEKNLGVTATLKTAIEHKIDFKVVHKGAFQKIAQYLLIPPHPFLSMKLAFKTVNQFWYVAGDQSTDYNYYSKRLLLMYVYIPTMAYLLMKDKSKESVIAFMNRRFTEVAFIPKIKQKIKNFV
jgi:ubiquinone biosynthesis protein COQ9